MTLIADRTAPTAATSAKPVAAQRWSGDAVAAAALSALFVLIVALTWRKWGTPEIDAGAELTTAERVAHGAMPYQDIRYFYGPLGLYGLAGAFKLFGTSFTTAFAFGLVETAGILATFYALGRRWLPPITAALATAALMGIAFSGTAFDFVLPHTNSATTGTLATLLMLLAISRGRLVWAGVAAGLLGLTRPEFAAIGAGVLVAATIGTWRDAGVPAAVRAAIRMAVPAIAIPTVVLGALAVKVGAAQLFTENLWPVDFIKANGLKAQENWAPFSAVSIVGLALRLGVYGALLGGVVLSAIRWRDRGGSRVRALAPLGAAVAGLVVAYALARGLGLFPGTRGAIRTEARHALLGMSVLPAVAFAVGAYAFVRLLRGARAPLSGSWAADLALLAAAVGLALRAYNAFTTEGSYAPYYAAPALLVLAIVHERIGDLRPQARGIARAALGVVGAGLIAYALVGLYADDSVAVHTAHGTFVTEPAAARALQPTLTALRATDPARPIVAAPADGGLYFMAGRRPALYDIMLLPGDLDAVSDERAAIARMRQDGVQTVVVAQRSMAAFGHDVFGVDYNRALGAFIRGASQQTRTFGEQQRASSGTIPSRRFSILTLGY
ncbi:MAG TPA: hypothetical protein VI318_12385 [Baekduia sp.]